MIDQNLYDLIPCRRLGIIHALQRGELDYVGTMAGHFPNMTNPQVCSINGHLVASAVSSRSCHVDLFYYVVKK